MMTDAGGGACLWTASSLAGILDCVRKLASCEPMLASKQPSSRDLLHVVSLESPPVAALVRVSVAVMEHHGLK